MNKNEYNPFVSYKGSITLGAGLIPNNPDVNHILIQSWNVQINEEGNTLYDYIEEGGGGSGLPEYTAADNDKFLRIVNGEPKWVAIEDGDGVAY